MKNKLLISCKGGKKNVIFNPTPEQVEAEKERVSSKKKIQTPTTRSTQTYSARHKGA